MVPSSGLALAGVCRVRCCAIDVVRERACFRLRQLAREAHEAHLETLLMALMLDVCDGDEILEVLVL